jgi:hypothetical protein
MVSELQENFNKLKHALENDYAIIPIAEYHQREKQFQAMREGLKEAMELIETFANLAGYVNPPMLDLKEEKALGKRIDALKALLATLPDSD